MQQWKIIKWTTNCRAMCTQTSSLRSAENSNQAMIQRDWKRQLSLRSDWFARTMIQSIREIRMTRWPYLEVITHDANFFYEWTENIKSSAIENVRFHCALIGSHEQINQLGKLGFRWRDYHIWKSSRMIRSFYEWTGISDFYGKMTTKDELTVSENRLVIFFALLAKPFTTPTPPPVRSELIFCNQ